MRYKIYLLLAALSLLNAACSSTLPSLHPYKVDIQQGNVVTYKMVQQLHPGMTKSQVRFIMGTPLIQDTFHSNRWDYFYQMRKDGKVFEQRRVILDFKDDQLVNVGGDTVTEAAIDPIGTSKSALVEPESKQGLWDRLKFWKKDETVAPIIASAKTSESIASELAKPEAAKVEVAKTELPKLEESKLEEKPADEPKSLLAIPIEPTGVPGVETPTVEAVKPVDEAPVPTPVSGQDAVVAETKEPNIVTMQEADSTVVIEAVPSSLILDRVLTLDLGRLKQRVLTPLAGAALKLELTRELHLETFKANPVKEPDQKAAEPAPGYFERMMEKIGF